MTRTQSTTTFCVYSHCQIAGVEIQNSIPQRKKESETVTNKTKMSWASGRLYQQLTGKQRRGTVTYVTNGYLLDTERNGKFCVLQPRVLLKSPARY